MMRPTFARIAAAALAFALAACGGAGDHALPTNTALAPLATNAALRQHRTSRVILHIRIPHRKHRKRRHGARYVSSSTAALAYAVTYRGHTVRGGRGFANLTIASGNCTRSGALQPLICTVAMPLVLRHTGSYTFAIAALDHTQATNSSCAMAESGSTWAPNRHCAGSVLSQGIVVRTLTPGLVNSVGIALGGIPASVTVAPLSPGYLQRGGPNLLELWGPSAQELVIDARDADGNAIVGPGAPTYRITSADTNMLAVSAASSTTPNVVVLQAKTSGSPAVVTPGTVNLQIAVTPSACSGDTKVLTRTFTVRIAHSLLYVSNNAGSDVYVYEDGNTSASATITDGIDSPNGVAVDAAGTLYVANFSGGSSGTVTEYPAGSTSYSTQITNGIDNPTGVAADDAGTLYVANAGGGTSGTVTEYPAGSTSYSAQITDGIGTPNCVAVDAAGTLYVVNANGGGGSETITEYPAGSTSYSTQITDGIGAPRGVAVDAAGTLYVTNLIGGTGSGSVTEYPAGSTSYSAQIANGVDGPLGAAVDAAGTLYVANVANTTVTEYPAGSTVAATTLNLGYTPFYLAVVPAAVAP